ncbi:DUF2141 domain-containing protein [Caenibius sp. WL]|uniref:DUF2141 domain-containing protein n=1 Tax=Caenibius sp. WL TaxID=2872646 RepID=UPI001C99D85C|nr:DUF2141 domain-containing protein [Caenibius sp. WL]QZP07654.1 DUF2141 domain-containing protein [Caenibius sp. WL]
MVHRFAAVIALVFSLGSIAADANESNLQIDLNVVNVASSKGLIRVAVCPRGSGFPECTGPGARTYSFNAAKGTTPAVIMLSEPGDYAISVFHDRNSNNQLDTFAGIPKEGYGFSKNPGFKPRAPRFEEAQVNLTRNANLEIRLQYIF